MIRHPGAQYFFPAREDRPIAPGGARLLILLLILALTFLVFSPSLHNGFTSWDDNAHVYENVLVRSLRPGNILEIFRHTVYRGYIPLTVLSFALEYRFFGYNPFFYHLDNVLLHLAVTACVFIFALRLKLSLPAAAVASLLFGIHPVLVESVSWVTERKDVLYGLFYMLSLMSYWSYLETRRTRPYALSLLWGLFAILSKAMALSLPLIILLCDWFYGRKFDRKTLLEKIPYFLCIVPIAGVTYYFNARIPGNSFGEGALVWTWTFLFYLRKFLFPYVLLPCYALPKPVVLANWHYWSSAIAFIAVSGIVVALRKRRFVLFAFLYYVLSIFFLLRYDDKYDTTVVADRFMYLPCLGFCLLIGIGTVRLLAWVRGRAGRGRWAVLVVFLILLFAALALKSHTQAQKWKDGVILWRESIEKNSKAYYPYYFRGYAYVERGEYEKAIEDYNKALAVNPNQFAAYNDRGLAYLRSGKFDLALKDINRAIALNPRAFRGYVNRGDIYAALERFPEAFADYQKALDLGPRDSIGYIRKGNLHARREEYPEALASYARAVQLNPFAWEVYLARGDIYAFLGKNDQAAADYSRVLQINPECLEAYVHRGNIHFGQGKMDLALADYSSAIARRPKVAELYNNRGLVYVRKKDYDAALKDFSAAVDLNPANARTVMNLAVTYATMNMPDAALGYFNRTIAIDPDNAEAYFNRGLLYANKGEVDKAVADFDAVLDISPGGPLAARARAKKTELKQNKRRHLFLNDRPLSPEGMVPRD